MGEKEMQSADVCTHKNKIKTSFAKIFVFGTPDRPYFNILYFDPVDQDYHVGFSSYFLEYVFKWLSEEFEIEDAPAANGAPVVYGRWEWFDEDVGTPVTGYEREWGWRCSHCGEELPDDYDDPDDSPKFRFCYNCGAKMDGEP